MTQLSEQDLRKRQRARNRAVLIALLVIIALIYAVTMIKLGLGR
jgi:hypothetical protein